MIINKSHIGQIVILVVFIAAGVWATSSGLLDTSGMQSECIKIKSLESLSDFDRVLFNTDRGYVLRVYHCDADPKYWYATQDGEITSRLKDACAEREMDDYYMDWRSGTR